MTNLAVIKVFKTQSATYKLYPLLLSPIMNLEFKQFSNDRDLSKFPPGHSRENLSEMEKPIERVRLWVMLEKIEDLYLAHLAYMNTPLDISNLSPAQHDGPAS